MQLNHSFGPPTVSYAFLVDDFGTETFLAMSDFRSNLAAVTIHNYEAAESAHAFIYTQDIDL